MTTYAVLARGLGLQDLKTRGLFRHHPKSMEKSKVFSQEKGIELGYSWDVDLRSLL